MSEIQVGTLVKVKSHTGVWKVEWINDNPNYVKDDEFYAQLIGLQGLGGVSIESPEEMEFYAEKGTELEIPTQLSLIEYVTDSIHTNVRDEFVIEESNRDGDRIYVSGSTDEGLRFTFDIIVANVMLED